MIKLYQLQKRKKGGKGEKRDKEATGWRVLTWSRRGWWAFSQKWSKASLPPRGELVYAGGDQRHAVDKRSHKWERRGRWWWCPNRRSSHPVRAQLWPHVAAGDHQPPFYTEIRPPSFTTISAPSLVLPKPPEHPSLSEAEVLQLEEVSRNSRPLISAVASPSRTCGSLLLCSNFQHLSWALCPLRGSVGLMLCGRGVQGKQEQGRPGGSEPSNLGKVIWDLQT